MPSLFPARPDLPSPRDPVAAAAESVFGVRYLYPYQRLVVANILDAFPPPPDSAGSPGNGGVSTGEGPGESGSPDRLRQIVLLPTGYGKSLCFQLPAVLLPGLTLVVFPLRSLMADQARRLRERGLSCAVLQGGRTDEERRSTEDAVRSGTVRIVLANPEILRTGGVLSLLRTAGVAHAVVDEAHCVAEWGDDFRPAYEDLGDILRSLDPPAVTAFTATASPEILSRISEVLFEGEPWRLVSGDPDRPNLRYRCVSTLSPAHSLESLARALPKPLLVFCASRVGAQITAERLVRVLGTREVRFYHAGMTKAERKAVEDWFLPSRDGILTATCAFGMGIDKPDIRAVIHADPPPSVESYLQESGRAGRDGRVSEAVLITQPRDRETLGRETDPIRRRRRAAVLDYAETVSRCRREILLGLLGARVEACAGCDVCAGRANPEPEGRAEILRFAAANSGRWGVSEASRRLAGRSGPCAGSGSLEGWEPEHVAEALVYLAGRGDLELPRRGPWKGRVLGSRSGSGFRGAARPLLFRGFLRGFLRRGRGHGGRLPRPAPAEGGGPALNQGDVAEDAPHRQEDRQGGQGLPALQDLQSQPEFGEKAVHGSSPVFRRASPNSSEDSG